MAPASVKILKIKQVLCMQRSKSSLENQKWFLQTRSQIYHFTIAENPNGKTHLLE